MADVLNRQQFPGEKKLPWVKSAENEIGETGNRRHVTRVTKMLVPTHLTEYMPGMNGERPGEHRKYSGQDWESFKGDVGEHGVTSPIMITVHSGERPRISEGNNRRDAAVATGKKYLPARIEYTGHSEQDSDLEAKSHDWWETQKIKGYNA